MGLRAPEILKCLVSISICISILDNDSTILIRIHLRTPARKRFALKRRYLLSNLGVPSKDIVGAKVTRYYASEFAFKIRAKKV